jgi:hypothetical protein
MDEQEYEDYLKQIESLSHRSADIGDKSLLEQLYDETGPVPGCYRTLPAPVDE